MNKIEALAKHLGVETDELSESRHDSNVIEYGRQEYLVLDDSEADEKVSEYIKETLWAFRSEFLASHMEGVDAKDLEPIQEKCERANPILFKLIDDFDHFVSDAVSSDGRGHFLAQYDGEEIELDNGLFAFRTN